MNTNTKQIIGTMYENGVEWDCANDPIRIGTNAPPTIDMMI